MYPVLWIAQSSLRCTPSRPVHSGTNSTSLGSILATQQMRQILSLAFPPLPIARCSFIRPSELGRMERTKMSKLQNGSRGGSNAGSLDCVLPPSHRACRVYVITSYLAGVVIFSTSYPSIDYLYSLACARCNIMVRFRLGLASDRGIA